MNTYSIKVPLLYNQNELYTDEPVVSEIFHLNKPFSQSLKSGLFIKLYELEKVTYCEVQNLKSISNIQAKQTARPIINYICFELTYVFNKTNSNFHILQPRIEADWINCLITKSEEQNSLVNTDRSDLGIVELKESVSIMLQTIIDPDTIDISWNQNPNQLFMMEEFYLALGTETIKSKFLHLYSILEHCEHDKNITSKIKIKKLLSKEMTDDIYDYIKEKYSLDDNKNNKIKSELSKLYDSSRTQVQLDILNYMGINTVSFKGKKTIIDLDFMKKASEQRNSISHGREVKQEDLNEYVAKLLDIDIRIVMFYRNLP